MIALLATIRKELQLLLRDIHGLMLLFVMPVVFILIMSLALQDQFAQRDGKQKEGGKKIVALLVDESGSEEAKKVAALLQQRPAFSWQITDNTAARNLIQHDKASFQLTLHQQEQKLQADILVAPSTTRQTEAIFTATVGEAMSRQRVEALLRDIKMKRAMDGNFSLDNDFDENAFSENPVTVNYSYRDGGINSTAGKQPTSVQQSVPAWLVFAMFFSVVPLSNTLIGERQQGTLRRMRTMPVSPYLPVIGKFIPYFFINQIQVMLMLAVGVYVMPLFGADRLTLGDSLAGLALMAISLSVAALGYGILIAVIARTTDQAATLGGVGNILLAALGGVMVPRFVMPATMQKIAEMSPMAWGLDGFLDIFLRNGNVQDVLPEAGSLLLFGCVTIGLAIALSLRRYP